MEHDEPIIGFVAIFASMLNFNAGKVKFKKDLSRCRCRAGGASTVIRSVNVEVRS